MIKKSTRGSTILRNNKKISQRQQQEIYYEIIKLESMIHYIKNNYSSCSLNRDADEYLALLVPWKKLLQEDDNIQE